MSQSGLWYVVNSKERRRSQPNKGELLDDGYREGWGVPVWRDEFDSDLSQWNVRNNFMTFDTARAMASNVAISSGVLHLNGKWLETTETGGDKGIITHTTGYIDTRNLTDADNPAPKHFSQQYGRWEVRCQTPTGPNTLGALAAFWLRCDNTPGEIDIMEAWGGGGTMSGTYNTYVKDSATTTFHSSTTTSTVNGKPYQKTFYRHWQHGGPRPVWDGMHTYGFEYTPDHISADVDGVQIFNVTPESLDPEDSAKTLAWLWDPDFFGSPFHIRMNLHVGPSASFWGLPDPNNRQLTVDPLDYAIEYVRAWEYQP